MTTPTELRPCPNPWCDRNFPGAKHRIDQLRLHGAKPECWQVECGYCGIGVHGFETEAEAIAAWNHRPTLYTAEEVSEIVKTQTHRAAMAIYRKESYSIFMADLKWPAIESSLPPWRDKP